MAGLVLNEIRDGVRTITLNRPASLNAMVPALLEAVAAAFRAANADPATRAIIFAGAGRAFCAGADLKERSPATSEVEARARVGLLQQVTREIVFGDKVVIGAIQGWAVGGGFEWALNCDFPIWAEGAKGFFPEVGWGLFVTGGVTTILPNIVGLPKAKEMLMFGERYTARDLADLGVAWRVVPDADLMAEAEAVASRLAALPARAVRDMKRTLVRAAHGDIATALDLETEATVRSRMDPDTPGRIAAFAARK